jgi:hypothetical protein
MGIGIQISKKKRLGIFSSPRSRFIIIIIREQDSFLLFIFSLQINYELSTERCIHMQKSLGIQLGRGGIAVSMAKL